MTFARIVVSLSLLIAGTLCCSRPHPGESALERVEGNPPLLLFDFSSPLEEGRLQAIELDTDQVVSGKGGVLRIQSSPSKKLQRVILKPPRNYWDLSDYEYLKVSLRNLGTNSLDLVCQIENPERSSFGNFNAREITIHPGEEKDLRVTFIRTFPAGTTLFGMYGFPGRLNARHGLRPEIVSQLGFVIGNGELPHDFEIGEIMAGGSYEYPAWIFSKPEKYFPCIDKYGQFMYGEWPGKIDKDEALWAEKEKEQKDLDANKGPDSWDIYGGWKEGPRFQKGPGFRPLKHEGKWWLVSPEGSLFWLHGINCVRFNNGVTPISDREHWYRSLPKANDTFAQFLETGRSAHRGYYSGRSYTSYDFSSANLYRKYGEDWKHQSLNLAHVRLRNWGLNTIGNWSDETIYLERRTPYVANISFNRKTIEGSPRFPDPFDPTFKRNLINRLHEERGKTAQDPWCIGYFVDNELRWVSDTAPALYALQSPASQPAKQVLINDLRTKYSSIQGLNLAWHSDYASWKELERLSEPPDRDGDCEEDLLDFSRKLADTYFRKVKEAIDEVTPDRLYLGCRFGQFAAAEIAVIAAAKHCDVLSFNLYKPFNRSATKISLPENVDKPLLVGEFHFGALDRGPLGTGLALVEGQTERAESYKRYVRNALRHPNVVGTNWFQYSDQATTGRPDGENYQIGFVDICDTPYVEIIEAAREVGYELYGFRSSN